MSRVWKCDNCGESYDSILKDGDEATIAEQPNETIDHHTYMHIPNQKVF